MSALMLKQPLQALVGAKLVDVTEACAPGRQQQDNRFGLLRVRCPAVTLTDAELHVELLAHAKRPHRLQYQRQSRVRRHRGFVVGDFDPVRQHSRLASHDVRQNMCTLHKQENSSVGGRRAIATHHPQRAQHARCGGGGEWALPAA